MIPLIFDIPAGFLVETPAHERSRFRRDGDFVVDGIARSTRDFAHIPDHSGPPASTWTISFAASYTDSTVEHTGASDEVDSGYWEKLHRHLRSLPESPFEEDDDPEPLL